MRKLLLMITLFLSSFIYGQDDSKLLFTVSGKVIDAHTKEPLEYATIVFKNKDSNEILCGGITNQRGNFYIDVEKGNYNVSIEFISYITKNLSISEITKNINVGTIELTIDTESLKEIEIDGKVNTLSIKQNKQVYNVSKDLSQTGASAAQILNNIPSVTVGADGDLSIKGQGNVTVLIDGKMSYLSKADALQTLPAGSIEKIEVISNPGASYRASASGIINIILKKGKNEGFNTSVTGSIGYKEVYGGLLTLNYKTEKVNFFTTTSYAHKEKNTLIDVENEYFNNGITTGFLEENTLVNSPSNDFMVIVGAEFYLSDKSTLTASTNYDDINRRPFYTTNSDFFNASYAPTNNNIGYNDSQFESEIVEFTLDFKQAFKNEGQELETYITYSRDNEKYNNDFSNLNPDFIEKDFMEENTLKNTEVSVKYTHPLNETASLAMGYLGTFGQTYFNLNKENITENINYTDNINGLFIEYEKVWDTFYAGFGLRAEFTELLIEYENFNSVSKYNFNDLFPSIYLEYTIQDNQSLSLSSSRTIERPGYYELRPYEQKISETLSYIGNIHLMPTYIVSTNLAYTFYGESLIFVSSLYWNHYDDLIQPVSFETTEFNNGIPKVVTSVENIGKLDMYGLSLIADLQATDWLNFIGNANIYQMDQTGIFEYEDSNNQIISKDFENRNFSGDFSLLTKIEIPKLFDFQFNIINNLKSVGAYSTKYANTYVNAAINKDICNNNASLSLSIDDVFNTRQLNRTWFEPDYTSKRISREKYQTIILSFTYRFNQNKEHRSINFDKKPTKLKL